MRPTRANPLRGMAWGVLGFGAVVGTAIGILGSWFGGAVAFVVGVLLAGLVDSVGAEATRGTLRMVLGGGIVASVWMLLQRQVGVAIIIGLVTVLLVVGLWVAQARGRLPASAPLDQDP